MFIFFINILDIIDSICDMLDQLSLTVCVVFIWTDIMENKMEMVNEQLRCVIPNNKTCKTIIL